MPKIDICFATDNKYAKHMGVCIASILINSIPTDKFNFYVLDGGISEKNIAKLNQLKKIKDFEIEFIKMDNSELQNCPLNRNHISIATFYRLKIPKLLSNKTKRVLYLDCDTIVLEPLGNIYFSDFENKYVMVIEDEGSIVQSKRMELSPSHTYFNAGVIIFNLEAIKEKNFEQECFNYLTKNFDKITLQDQDILNGVLENKCKYLHLRYNANGRIFMNNELENKYTEEEIQEATKNPAILHFTDIQKPWLVGCKHPLKKLYFKYLIQTPWKLCIIKDLLKNFFPVRILYKLYRTILKKIEIIFKEGCEEEIPGPVINICFAADDKYAQPVAVSIASIIKNGDDCDRYYFGIMDGGISEKNKKKILNFQKNKNVRIEFIKINSNDFINCPITNYVDYITIATYYRFKAASLFPDLDKILYLDCDTVILKDIKALFETDISDYYLAGVPEIGNQHYKARLEISDDNHFYINAGVLLLNLKKWREDNIEGKLFNYAKNPKRKIILQDQDIINEVLKYKIKYLEIKWNLQHGAINREDSYIYHREEWKIANDTPSILHFTHRLKPWHAGCKNIYKYEYTKYLKLTPYSLSYLTIKIKQMLHAATGGILISLLSKFKATVLNKVKKGRAVPNVSRSKAAVNNKFNP